MEYRIRVVEKEPTLAKRRQLLNKIKTDRGCESCGLKGMPAVVYDFHHRDRKTKKFSLSGASGSKRPWWRTLKEVEKCDVLCANCHRLVEWGGESE